LLRAYLNINRCGLILEEKDNMFSNLIKFIKFLLIRRCMAGVIPRLNWDDEWGDAIEGESMAIYQDFDKKEDYGDFTTESPGFFGREFSRIQRRHYVLMVPIQGRYMIRIGVPNDIIARADTRDSDQLRNFLEKYDSKFKHKV
jgi:hypothetical protein